MKLREQTTVALQRNNSLRSESNIAKHNGQDIMDANLMAVLYDRDGYVLA